MGEYIILEKNVVEEVVNEENVQSETAKTEKNDLTDKDFYDQACQYFYYHAEQRMNMINYYIAVFGAGIALYGNVLEKSPAVAAIIAVFLFVISLLFCSIDFRNKFDVKQSQSVIAQIERDYGRDKLATNADATYGVFSNEDNTFRYHGYEHRNEDENAKYRELRAQYKVIKKLKKKKADEAEIKALEDKLDKEIAEYLDGDRTISKKELKKSLGEISILSLSNSIKCMYILCMVVSVMGMVSALWLAGFFNFIIDILKLIFVK